MTGHRTPTIAHDGPTDDASEHDSSGPRRPARVARLGTVVMALLGVGAAFSAALAVWFAATGRYVLVGGGASPYLTLADLPQLLQADPSGEATIRVVDLPLWVRVLAWAPEALVGALLVAVAVLTTRVLRAIGRGEPFRTRTVRAVRRTGLVLTLGGLAAGALDTTAAWVLFRTQSDAWQPTYSALGFTGGSWPLSLIVTGVVVLAAAAAFREGARLRSEFAHVV